MRETSDGTSDREHRFNQVAASYVQAVEEGRSPSRGQLLARFPELASELNAFFDDHDRLNRLAAPLRAGAQGCALVPTGPVLETLAGTIGSVPRVLLPDTQLDDRGVALVRPSSPEMPPPGDRAGRYHFFGEIARGGMGAVLKGRDNDLGRELAVKVLLESHQGNPDLVRRFVEEAQIGGQLQHPGIVPVYELGAFGDRRPYFTMKLVKGRTLAALLEERKRPTDDLPRLIGVFEQVCQTIAYTHARSVIHRDLKPSNIMVGNFGEVQVMDWGLAKVLKPAGDSAEDEPTAVPPTAVSVIRTVRSESADDGSQAGSTLGTPAYMAPEQALGDVAQIDRRADVFGLGSILCELLTGRPAYTGRARAELLRKAVRGDTADALARLDASGADAELVALAKDCLTVEPLDRPADAGVVAACVRAYLTGVQEKLRIAELARVEAQARADEEAKRRALADELAVAAEGRVRAEAKRRRATLGLAAASALALVALAGVIFGLIENARVRESRGLALAEAERARRLDYFHRIALAEREWSGNNARRAEQLLDECPADLRGWEWDYLKLSSHSDYLTTPNLSSAVWGVAFSPDRRTIASVAQYGGIQLWDATTLGALGRLPEMGGMTIAAAFSSDGKRIAVGVSDPKPKRPGAIWIWELDSRKSFTFPAHVGVISSVAFSPDDERLASAGVDDRTVCVWNAATGKRLRAPLSDPVEGFTSVAFSPDGTRLAAATGTRDEYAIDNRPGAVKVWDTATWLPVYPDPLRNHTRGVNCIAYSPDGRRLASASSDRTVKLWDTATGQELSTFRGHTQFVVGVAFSPDGKQIVSASEDGSLKVWDGETDESLVTLRGHVGMVNCVAFSADGHHIAAGGDDDTVKLWDLNKAHRARILGGPRRKWFTRIAFDPDGKRLAAANADHSVTVWDVPAFREAIALGQPADAQGASREAGLPVTTVKLTEPIWSVAFSRDGVLVASCSGRWNGMAPGAAEVWDAATRRLKFPLPSEVRVVWSVAFSPAEDLIATAGGDLANGPAELKLWRCQKIVHNLKGHTRGVYSVAFSPNGKRLASAANDGMVKVWDVASGSELFGLRGEQPSGSMGYGTARSVTFDRDGRRIAAAGVEAVTIWDATTGEKLQVLRGHVSYVQQAVFHPSEERLATAGYDGTVKIWDLRSGQELLTLRGHRGPVEDVAFSPDGHTIASASRDGTVRIWDASP